MDVYTLEPLLSLPESLLDSSLPLKGKQQAMVILQERQLQGSMGKAAGRSLWRPWDTTAAS